MVVIVSETAVKELGNEQCRVRNIARLKAHEFRRNTSPYHSDGRRIEFFLRFSAPQMTPRPPRRLLSSNAADFLERSFTGDRPNSRISPLSKFGRAVDGFSAFAAFKFQC